MKAPDSKSGLGAILTWVRIPPLPPTFILANVYRRFVSFRGVRSGSIRNDISLVIAEGWRAWFPLKDKTIRKSLLATIKEVAVGGAP